MAEAIRQYDQGAGVAAERDLGILRWDVAKAKFAAAEAACAIVGRMDNAEIMDMQRGMLALRGQLIDAVRARPDEPAESAESAAKTHAVLVPFGSEGADPNEPE